MGTRYAGFQSQPGKETVQTALERAVTAVTGESVKVIGSGRTDAGAHALGQVVAFRTESVLPAGVLQRAINAHLPSDIAVREACDVSPDFHPRYDAHRRLYRYLIWNHPVRSPLHVGRAHHVRPRLDVEAMNRAAQALVGTHDFNAFVTAGTPGPRERTIFRASVQRDGDLVCLEFEGTGFMRAMVRSIVGTLVRAGLGKLSIADFAAVLESRQRAAAGDTAPAHGLYLIDVQYEPPHHQETE